MSEHRLILPLQLRGKTGKVWCDYLMSEERSESREIPRFGGPSRGERCANCRFWYNYGPWKNKQRNWHYCVRDFDKIRKSHLHDIPSETEFQARMEEFFIVSKWTAYCPHYQHVSTQYDKPAPDKESPSDPDGKKGS